MNRPARTLYGLAAVGAATAVGITTRDAGFTVITFLGTLWLPRILGLRGRRGPHGFGAFCGARPSGRSHLEERLGTWHRQAHGEPGTTPPTTPTAGAAPA